MGADDVFGLIGLILGVSTAISPVQSFVKGLKDMEIKNIAYSYLLFAIGNCLFWGNYGLHVNKFYIYCTNLIMLVLFMIYLNLYYYINKCNGDMLTHSVGIIALFIFVYYLLPTYIIGIIAFVINTAWMSTSLVTMKQALINKDASFLNLTMALVTTACCGFWMLYGISISDALVIIPNFIGVILWACNFLIYYWSIGKISNDNFGIVILKKALSVSDDDNISSSREYKLKTNESDF